MRFPLVACATIGALAVSWASPASGGAAGGPPVTLGEVSSSAAHSHVDVRAVLRAAAVRELATLERPRLQKRGVVLSLAVVQMDTVLSDRSSAATCVVSATLRDEKRGVLIAILGGKARAEDGAARAAVVETSAIEAAVKGAIARVPEAVP